MKINLLRKEVIDYPSGSAIEFDNDLLYVIGDDVSYILCLDAQWKPVKKITLFDFEGKRIPKTDKPDLECAAVINDQLYVLGSGSRSPQRDVAFIVQFSNDSVKKINTNSFYSLFRNKQLIMEMNIEGFAACRDKLLFFNRGNTQYPNQLIITDQKILKKQFPGRFKVMPVQTGNIGNIPLGISGACYDSLNDILLLTASAEDTSNAYDDGTIAGSAVLVVRNAYKKLDDEILTADEVFLLGENEPAFIQQKIESICITKQQDKNYTCVLVADNDDGNSTLFEVEISLE
ncbi:MAG: hypothetical protein JWN78_505 [Bacteroidota bacterium]|nr:hypothetical protein [Bacteroidota bacterium]